MALRCHRVLKPALHGTATQTVGYPTFNDGLTKLFSLFSWHKSQLAACSKTSN